MTDNNLADALRMAVRQNSHDMLMTGEELRECSKALAEHDAPEECFCDRMYPDSNPNASCGDCPTRDYAPKPAPSSVQVDVLGELADEIEAAYPNADASNLRAFAAAHPPAPAADGAGELPPLPPVDGYDKRVVGHYSAASMHAYARAAIAAQQESRND